MNTLPEPFARAIRTFLQAAIGTYLALAVLPHAAPGTVPDWGTTKEAALAALFAGVVAVLSYAQNYLESTGGLPPILKPPTIPPGEAVIVATGAPPPQRVEIVHTVQQAPPPPPQPPAA